MSKFFDYLDNAFSVETISKLILLVFVIVPIGTSFISTYHTYHLFKLGNTPILAFGVSFTFELIALGTLGMVVLYKDKISNIYLWGVFVFMTCVQIIGNVYYGFNYAFTQIATDENYFLGLTRFMNQLIGGLTQDNTTMVLAMFIGIPVPLLSSILVHMSSEYLKKVIDDKNLEAQQIETSKDELILELESELENVKDALLVHEPYPPTKEELMKELEDYKNRISTYEPPPPTYGELESDLNRLNADNKAIDVSLGNTKHKLVETLRTLDEKQNQIDSLVADLDMVKSSMSTVSNENDNRLSEYEHALNIALQKIEYLQELTAVDTTDMEENIDLGEPTPSAQENIQKYLDEINNEDDSVIISTS